MGSPSRLVSVLLLLPLLLASSPLCADAVVASAAAGEVAGRVVVVSDVHGDIDALRESLMLANVTDAAGAWVGGQDTLVQLGDLVDRGPFSDLCVEFMVRLKAEARRAGGEAVLLIGNHEVMAVQGVAEYVNDWELTRLGGYGARGELFAPSGRYGRMILQNFQAAYVRGSTLFVHAGLEPEDARLGVAGLNELTARLLRNVTLHNHEFLAGSGPFWNRRLLTAAKRSCTAVDAVLRAMSEAEGRVVERMVVGHTIQKGQVVTKYCGGSLIAADVGMSNGTVVGSGRRRAATIMRGGSVTTLYRGEVGEGLDLPQVPMMVSFAATIVTPCVAIGTCVLLMRALKSIRYRLELTCRSCLRSVNVL